MPRQPPAGLAIAVAKPGLAAAIVGASGLVAVQAFTGVPPFPYQVPMEFWVLAGLALIADLRPFPVPGTRRRVGTIFLSICFTFAIMLLWGAGPAIVVQTVAVTGAALRQRFSVARTVFIVGRFVLALVAADAVLDLFGPPPFALGIRVDRSDVLAVVLAAAVWFAVNYLILTIGIRLRYGSGLRQVFSRTFGYELLSTGALLLLAPLLVSAPTGWVILLVLVPVFAVNQMARLSSDQEEQIRLDPLTGLLSRRALRAEVDELVAADVRRRAGGDAANHFALLVLDLDKFKDVNDALGHAVGDRLLADVARRISAAVRNSDMVGRLGGDEFAVIAPDVPDVAAARTLAAKIARALNAPSYLDGLPLDVSASIGVALCPEHGRDFATLMRHADVAMYDAKQRGDAIAAYAPESDHNSAERLSLLADLRIALENPDHAGEIEFHYQPQVAIMTGDVVGVEALVRWRTPERGLVAADELVRAAEHSAVMRLLTLRAVDDVVSQLAAWNSAGINLRASINVSVRDLHSTDIVDHIQETLRRHGVSAGQLEVEITETALMADPQRVLTTVHQLADVGVALSLDDFGTGYSSLLHLRRLPLAEVKIDRSFVQRMAADPDDEAIVRSIIDLSNALGLRVVAEGVEDDMTSRLLADAGCDIGQGWYYARPMPAAELTAWLARRSHRTGP